jgi:hypothetical protein
MHIDGTCCEHHDSCASLHVLAHADTLFDAALASAPVLEETAERARDLSDRSQVSSHVEHAYMLLSIRCKFKLLKLSVDMWHCSRH